MRGGFEENVGFWRDFAADVGGLRVICGDHPHAGWGLAVGLIDVVEGKDAGLLPSQERR